MSVILIPLLIAVFMIAFTLFKAHTTGIITLCCKKSEVAELLRDVPDDCAVQILIGGNYYEHKQSGSP